MKRLSFKILLLALIVSILPLSAQDMREKIAQDPNYAGSNLLSYIYKPTVHTPAPKGYKPFYISTYGRHGSRWHTRPKYYERILKIFGDAEKMDALTEYGKEVYGRVKAICEHAEGREGQLTTKGVKEHRGIAERMVERYPEIFSTKGGKECRIECLSTLYPRCLLSMAANNERIKELCPDVEFVRTTGERYRRFLAPAYATTMASNYDSDNVQPELRRRYVKTERFMNALFKPEYTATVDPYNVIQRIFYIAVIMQNFEDTTLSLYDLFTTDELYGLWRARNIHHYTVFGNSIEFGDITASDAVPLMRTIIADVDDVLANGGRSGCLRFGHDMTVVPLIVLLQMEGRSQRLSISDYDNIEKVWQDINITSMAANVQLVFYRNRQGDVLVKALHNEAEVRLPLAGDNAPYYRWEDFRSYYLKRIDYLSKVKLPEALVKYNDGRSLL